MLTRIAKSTFTAGWVAGSAGNNANSDQLSLAIMDGLDLLLARACGVPAVGVRAVDCWQ